MRSVDDGVVSYGHVVIEHGYRLFVCCVDAGIVLYVDTVAYSDGVDVSPQNSTVPDAAVVAYFNVAYDGGVFGNKTVFADFRGYPV